MYSDTDHSLDNHSMDELDDFIVSDEDIRHPETPNTNSFPSHDSNNVSNNDPNHDPNNDSDTSQDIDRIRQLTTELKPNETYTQKVLKGHISVLVSALGGPDHTSTPVNNIHHYKLGHDALACLKDIKRWLKSVDERNNTFDVALACADCGLVVNDLIVMLCQWDTQSTKKGTIKNVRTMEKIMLANLELLVLLTWPTDLTSDSTENQRLTFPNMRKSQLVYKKHILGYNNGQTLKAVLRLLLPTMSKDKLDREPRDNAILRLVLFFIRNILYIQPVPSSISFKRNKQISNLDNWPANVTMEDISHNTVLSCFKRNKVLLFLLMVSNAVGNDFDKTIFGPTCLESIFLLINNVPVNDLLVPLKPSKPHHDNNSQSISPQLDINPISSTAGLQLHDLLKEEDKKKKVHTQNLSTRHGRFGSLLSIQDEDRTYVVSGQEALHNSGLTLNKLDKSKKWHKTSTFRYDSNEYISSTKIYLNGSSLLLLRDFVEQFLAGDCFNNLMKNVASLLSGADDLSVIDPYERAVYFMTCSWFFNYKREKNLYYKANPDKLKTLTEDDDGMGFGSISSGLNQVNFILIISYFRTTFTTKAWNSVHVAMACFLELLLIAHSLFTQKSTSKDNEEEESDKELGEGIIRNLFTSFDFLNVLVLVPQSASKHSPEYLKTCIHMVHILLKSFDSFAKEDVKLYIQSRRRKVKTNKNISLMENVVGHQIDDLMDESDEEADGKRARQVKSERQLNLTKTETRFFHTNTVTSYIDYLSEYEDLSHEEIKRCLSYFHRLFVMRKDYTSLYRLDFMLLLQKLHSFLPKSSSIRKHVDEFIYYFMKKFKTSFSRFPMPIEVLFPRFDDTEYKGYLAVGDIEVKPTEAKSQPKLAKQIEFTRDNLTISEKVKILVSALYLQEKQDFLSWFVNALDAVIKQRVLDTTTNPGDLTSKILQSPSKFSRLFINNPYIRCLLVMVGFEVPEILEEKCELPSTISSEKLVEFYDLIKLWINRQPVTFEDGKDAMFFMRTKDSYEYDEYDMNYDGHYDPEDESIAFQTQGSLATASKYMEDLDRLDNLEALIGDPSRSAGVAKVKNKKPKSKSKPNDKPSQPKAKRGSTRRPPKSFDVVSDDEDNHPVRSSEYVNMSDDDSDDDKDAEFFEKEEKLRRLLETSGGIVDAKQLEEFKKVWSSLANGSVSNNMEQSINNAVRTASETIIGSVAEKEDKDGDDDDNNDDNNDDNSDNDNQNSTQLPFSDSEEESDSNKESDSDNEANKENNTPPEAKSKKRHLILSDDDDNDDNEATDENTFFSANEDTLPARKRKLVLEDDDDD